MKNLSFIRQVMGVISVLLMIVSIGSIASKGFNWGLDFTGGVVVDIQVDSLASQSELKDYFDGLLEQDVHVFSSGEPGQWQLRFGEGTETTRAILQEGISLTYPGSEILSSSVLGPQVGQEMIEQGGLAIITCFILIMLYLSVRFDWRLALGSITALIYDVLLVLGLFALTQMEFDLTVLAALLAVMGYSLNDSIIISDRIRETLRANPNASIDKMLDRSIHTTFSRTIVTSGTTLVTVSSLWLLGGPALEGFAIALCLGIASGTWSSISIGTLVPRLAGLQPSHYEIKKPSEYELAP